MKNPVRPAPAPPYSTGGNVREQRSMKQVNKWEDFSSEDPFFMPVMEGPRSKSTPPNRPPAKRQPPPRPPPPKFTQKPPTKSGNMLMNLFSRQPSSSTDQSRSANSSSQRPTRPVMKEASFSGATGSLINLNSPPSSPSPTSRSGSDGVSVNSFGSDGNAPNTNFSNQLSNFESGFEDSFDFFSSLSTNASTPESTDPWSSAFPQDPFSPVRLKVPPKEVAMPVQVTQKPSVSVKPTIIRAKSSKPSRASQLNAPAMKSIFDDESVDWSPPMPSMPPPPLPLDALKDFDPSPNVPPRPKSRHMESLKKPYGIALYDYEASHPDDLSFKANDVILLEREIDPDWLYGQVESREGMFPSNFVKIMVPLLGHQDKAIALYPFVPESWEDLEFPEGAEIKVTSQVNNDWLYGEYGGKSGQFPAAFIDHIPPNLPIRKA